MKYIMKWEEYSEGSQNAEDIKKKIQSAINEIIVNKALSQVCPNIVKCYRAFLSTKRVYIIQEFMENGTVEDFICKGKGRKYTEESCKYILYNVAKALHFMHEKGVLHRDLKSANVLIGGQGEIKICDFGFSRKNRENEERWTKLGTPQFMAPEIL